MDQLEEWRETMQPRLMRLQAFEMPPGFELDYSPSSLDALEAQLLARSSESFVDAAVGYLGEALLTTAGGGWDFSDRPVLRFDAALQLEPIAPLSIIRMASGHTFVDIQGRLREAVARRQASLPGWQPSKEPTPGLDPVPVDSDFLDAWLAKRAADFPRWVAEHAPATGGWDFPPSSLDVLESLVRRRLASVTDLDRPENQDFVEGAGWYLGEVLRREGHAEWMYHEGVPEPGNADTMFLGHPYVTQNIHNGQFVIPYLTFQRVIQSAPGFLRQRLGWFQDSHRKAAGRARRAS